MKVELETASLSVCGIRDAKTERGVCSALESIHGVRSAHALPHAGAVIVEFDPTRVVPGQLRTAVRVMGCRIDSIVLSGDDEAASARSAANGPRIGPVAPVFAPGAVRPVDKASPSMLS